MRSWYQVEAVCDGLVLGHRSTGRWRTRPKQNSQWMHMWQFPITYEMSRPKGYRYAWSEKINRCYGLIFSSLFTPHSLFLSFPLTLSLSLVPPATSRVAATCRSPVCPTRARPCWGPTGSSTASRPATWDSPSTSTYSQSIHWQGEARQ